VRDMQAAESEALEIAQEAAIDRFDSHHCFTAEDIRALHRLVGRGKRAYIGRGWVCRAAPDRRQYANQAQPANFRRVAGQRAH